MIIRLTKIKEIEDAIVPSNIEEGFIKIGELLGEPKVNQAFWVGQGWRTSTVTEIINKNTFKTLDSIYKWEEVHKCVGSIKEMIQDSIRTHKSFVEVNKNKILNTDNLSDIKVYANSIVRCIQWIEEDERLLKLIF